MDKEIFPPLVILELSREIELRSNRVYLLNTNSWKNQILEIS